MLAFSMLYYEKKNDKRSQDLYSSKMAQHVSMLCSFVSCGHHVDKEWEPVQKNLLTPKGAELNVICKQ